MKLLLVGDLHLRTKRPRCRMDEDFEWTCLNKLMRIGDLARKYGCSSVLQAGDFFDSPTPGYGLWASAMWKMDMYKQGPPWYVVHGQHDLLHHSQKSKQRSALQALDVAGAVVCVDDGESPWSGRRSSARWVAATGCRDTTAGKGKFGVDIYGMSFGDDETPDIMDHEAFNVLIAHAMVGDKPLWPGHDLTSPRGFVKRHPGFDLYLLGDYHYPFTVHYGDRVVINCGSVLRLTASERDMAHRPKVVIFDTDDRSCEDVYLDVEPAETAFDVSKKQQRDRPELDAFIAKLRDSGEVGVSFQENLLAWYGKHGTSEEIRAVVASSGV